MTGRPTCTVDGCDRTINARGLCHKHYKRYRKHGDPTIVAPKGGCTPYRRLAFEPLWRALSAREGYELSLYRMAQLCGVDTPKVYLWRRDGITWSKADRICVELLDTHPLMVWPDFYADIDVEGAA